MASSVWMWSLLILVLVSALYVSVVDARTPKTYNVQSFGALPNGKTDSSEALLAAWDLACKDSGSTVLFPNSGKFLLDPVTLNGPCAGPITFQMDGVLKAPKNNFLTEEQWILFNNLRNLTVGGRGGTFDGQGAYAWKVNPCKVKKDCTPFPSNIKFNGVEYGVIDGISSMNSKYFHIIVDNSEHIEIRNVNIYAPWDSPNTDGIHISRTSNVYAHNLDISTGDDCISLGPGSVNIEVYETRCGPGHGISIGSLGKYENEEDVSGIIVHNCTLTNTTNGVRIKTWAPSPSSNVFNVTFQDIILNQVRNAVVVDQHYCPYQACPQQGESQVQISNVKFINIVGTSDDEVSVVMKCSEDKP
ncbi:unnamed protein product, partial [Cuscuta europaea]